MQVQIVLVHLLDLVIVRINHEAGNLLGHIQVHLLVYDLLLRLGDHHHHQVNHQLLLKGLLPPLFGG